MSGGANPVTTDASRAQRTGSVVPANHAAETIGLVGLGLVGTALGGRLMRAGYSVLGYDSDPIANAAWQHRGGQLASSVSALGLACRSVVLAVFDTAGVLGAIEGHGGLLDNPADQIVTTAIIDCSTGDPDALLAFAQRLDRRGLALIEAPLSGSSQQIADGQATMLLGGSAAAIAAQEALLGALSAQRIHVGAAGMGARAKLATNLVLGLNRAALAEGLVFAQGQGIAAETFLALVLATPARSDAALTKGRRMVDEQFEPQSRIHQHLKDVQLMLSAAQAVGQRLPLSQAHAALLRAAVQAGDGELDNAAIVRQLRRETL